MNVLVDSYLHTLISEGSVTSMSGDIDLHDYVQPASIDLPIGDTVYLVKQKFLPFQQEVKYVVDALEVMHFDTQDEVILYKGQTYAIPCLEIDLPDHLLAKVSSKSSIGRIDVLVRTIFDHTGLYDTVLTWSKGQLRIEVTPQSFNIKVKKWIPLSQIMFFWWTSTSIYRSWSIAFCFSFLWWFTYSAQDVSW